MCSKSGRFKQARPSATNVCSLVSAEVPKAYPSVNTLKEVNVLYSIICESVWIDLLNFASTLSDIFCSKGRNPSTSTAERIGSTMREGETWKGWQGVCEASCHSSEVTHGKR